MDFLAKIMVRRSFEIWKSLSKDKIEKGLGIKNNKKIKQSISGSIGYLNTRAIIKESKIFKVVNKQELKYYKRDLFPEEGIELARKRARELARVRFL